jgi:hypothetical protein
MQLLYLIPIALLVLSTGEGHARIGRQWTYQELLKQSDIVVIANAIETKTVVRTDSLVENGLASFARSFEQLETVFRIRAVVKGNRESSDLVLVHFRFDQRDPKGGVDPPLLIVFPVVRGDSTAKTEDTSHGPEYLLFLRTRKDGRYDPVSGQVDPVWSVRQFRDPLQLLEIFSHQQPK